MKAKEGMDIEQWDLIRLTNQVEEARKQCRDQAASPAQPADVVKDSVTEDTSQGRADNMRIRVCVRKRPVNAKEMATNNLDIVTTRTAPYPNAYIHIHEPRTRLDLSKAIDTHSFGFDNVYDETASNKTIYDGAVRGLVEGMFRGGRVTLFAYGQTGSGKTHTIFGSVLEPGLFHHILQDIMSSLSHPSADSDPPELTLHLSFFELYGPQMYDLLNSRARVTLLESPNPKDPIYIQNLTSIHIPTDDPQKGIEKILLSVNKGFAERSTGSTDANQDSSRSHAVLQFTLKDSTSKPLGKFSLIDLAGSERATDRGSTTSPSTKWESSEINKSLLSLKECIRALHHHKPTGITSKRKSGTGRHIPFRGSKLTHVLRDSFLGQGNTTVMIACVAPGMGSCECTLNTLRYAGRVKGFAGKMISRTDVRIGKVDQQTADANGTTQDAQSGDEKGLPLGEDRNVERGADSALRAKAPSEHDAADDGGNTSSPSSESDTEVNDTNFGISTYLSTHSTASTPPPTVPLSSLSTLLKIQPPTFHSTQELLESHLIALTARNELVEAEKRMMVHVLDGEMGFEDYAVRLRELVNKRMAVDEELLGIVAKLGRGSP